MVSLRSELEACRAKSDGCSKEEQYEIVARYAQLSFQRDVVLARCLEDPSCDHSALLADSPFMDRKALEELIGIGGDFSDVVAAYIEKIAFQNHFIVDNGSPFRQSFREEFAWKERNCANLTSVQCGADYAAMALERGEGLIDASLNASIMMGGAGVIRLLISRGLGKNLVASCMRSRVCAGSMATAAGVDTVIDIQQCAGGNALACAAVLIPTANIMIGKTGISRTQLIDDLIANGTKITPENVVDIRKLPDGRTVWLETGNETAGLKHIVKEHGKQFVAKGIPEAELPRFVIDTLSNGKIIGTSSGAPVYQIIEAGVTHNVTIITGSNGFVVTAYPVSKWKPIP